MRSPPVTRRLVARFACLCPRRHSMSSKFAMDSRVAGASDQLARIIKVSHESQPRARVSCAFAVLRMSHSHATVDAQALPRGAC